MLSIADRNRKALRLLVFGLIIPFWSSETHRIVEWAMLLSKAHIVELRLPHLLKDISSLTISYRFIFWMSLVSRSHTKLENIRGTRSTWTGQGNLLLWLGALPAVGVHANIEQWDSTQVPTYECPTSLLPLRPVLQRMWCKERQSTKDGDAQRRLPYANHAAYEAHTRPEDHAYSVERCRVISGKIRGALFDSNVTRTPCRVSWHFRSHWSPERRPSHFMYLEKQVHSASRSIH